MFTCYQNVKKATNSKERWTEVYENLRKDNVQLFSGRQERRHRNFYKVILQLPKLMDSGKSLDFIQQNSGDIKKGLSQFPKYYEYFTKEDGV